ncbi:alpha/beta hydrolase [Streptomyces sp. S.PB5]|uniref:alpha/beta fold hydrolase n=1 Tax=Streptomyces sp. S.PB5 TaxID=3020844 RepID=UPI0025B13436|nr:alpha/beta hydrolase [Streptomyces sp. S.PB5]MDN3025844.1 alpha/beta hydrolase [Streptomyces sp. S.PB5]
MVEAAGCSGRKIACETWGDPDGYPVFLLHGTPGSRLGPRPLPSFLHRLGIHLIAYDRPGYGDSGRLAGRTVKDVVADVEAVATGLGLEGRYSVVGRSGGGPHALACAALNPKRVASAAALVSLAPSNAEGLDWYAGMAESNVLAYSRATLALRGEDPGHLTELKELTDSLARSADAVKQQPGSLLSNLDPELPAADREVVEDAGMRGLLLENYLQGVGESWEGWLDDVLALCSPWGFDPATIKDVPVLLWHGEHDTFCPVGHFRWLAERIPSATAVLQPSAAHFAALSALPEILAWVRDRALGRS